MVAQWFYQTAERQQSGPIDSKELRRLAEVGIVRPDTLVRKGVDGRWANAEKVRGLFQQSASPAHVTGRLAGGPPGRRSSDSSLQREPPSPPSMEPQPQPMPTTLQRGLVYASAERTEPGGNKIDREGTSVPYGLLFAWGWTLLFGAFLLFFVEQARYGLAALIPKNLIITIAYLAPSILILGGPTLPVAIAEWRRSKSPVAGSLIAVLALIVALLIAKVCRSPEVVPGFGWSIEDAELGSGSTAGSPTAPKEIRSWDDLGQAEKQRFRQALILANEIEKFMKEFMNQAVSQHKEYSAELDEIGWDRILDPERLARDTALSESKVTIREAKEIVDKYREQMNLLLAKSGKEINALNLSAVEKAEAKQAYERGMRESRNQMDQIWELEREIVSEFGDIIDFLHRNYGNWSVSDGQLLFGTDEKVTAYNSYLASIDNLVAKQEQLRRSSAQKVQVGLDRLRRTLGP